MIRNRRSAKRSVKQSENRHLRTATNFLKFSPVLLRFRLLPGWVYLSLAANGFLLAVVLVFLLRSASSGAVSSIVLTDPADTTNTAQVSLTTVASPTSTSVSSTTSAVVGERHQLSYQEWKNLLAQEARVTAEKKPQHLSVLAGDSISLWFPDVELPSRWNWLNQGISGETSAGLLKRLDLFDRTQPETVFIMIGINDLLRGIDVEEILDNQQQIVRYLKEMHPNAQIVLQSILPHGANKATWEGRDRLLKIPNQQIAELNRQLETIAQAEGVYFLDLYPVFVDAAGNLRMEYSTDGLHLNKKGYQVWSIALQVYGHEVLEPDLLGN